MAARLSTQGTSHRVTVMLVDDHAIWREGVRSMLKGSEFDVVAEAASGAEALEIAARAQPRIVLLDIRMADGDGFDTLAGLKEHHPHAAVVMLTTYDNPTFMARAVAAGAAGYLLKGITRQELLRTLRLVAGGKQLLSPKDLTRSLRGLSEQPAAPTELIYPLTDREMEVLQLLATGLTNREIALLLSIGDGTVKTHVEHILGKLGASDRVQAAVWAVRHDLVPRSL